MSAPKLCFSNKLLERFSATSFDALWVAWIWVVERVRLVHTNNRMRYHVRRRTEHSLPQLFS